MPVTGRDHRPPIRPKPHSADATLTVPGESLGLKVLFDPVGQTWDLSCLWVASEETLSDLPCRSRIAEVAEAVFKSNGCAGGPDSVVELFQGRGQQWNGFLARVWPELLDRRIESLAAHPLTECHSRVGRSATLRELLDNRLETAESFPCRLPSGEIQELRCIPAHQSLCSNAVSGRTRLRNLDHERLGIDRSLLRVVARRDRVLARPIEKPSIAAKVDRNPSCQRLSGSELSAADSTPVSSHCRIVRCALVVPWPTQLDRKETEFRSQELSNLPLLLGAVRELCHEYQRLAKTHLQSW